MYTFTTNWFDMSELKCYIHKYVNTNDINNFLEIGSHEGASACFISDNFLDNPNSSIICIDPFDESDNTTPVNSATKQIFINNIFNSKNWSKIKTYKLYSDDFFKYNKDSFTFIYIDGSHELENIKKDFINSINSIRLNGIIWMDDYKSNELITKLINELYNENKDKLDIIHVGYQIAFKKII